MAPHIDRARELITAVENDPNQYAVPAYAWTVWQDRAEELAEILSGIINHEKEA